MKSISNNLKWLCFSGLSDENPIGSTRFLAFSQSKGILETFTGDYLPSNPPESLSDGASDERVAHDAATEAYMKAFADMEKHNNTLWCYLAMVLDSTSLRLTKHDCVDNKGLGDERKAWVLLQQRFRSDEAVTVVSVMKQLAPLQLKEDEALYNYFLRAQELPTRLEHAGEHLSEPLLNAMMLNSLPECYENFVVQESFNAAGSFVDLRKKLVNYEGSRIHREYLDDVDSYVAMTSKKAKPKHKIEVKITHRLSQVQDS